MISLAVIFVPGQIDQVSGAVDIIKMVSLRLTMKVRQGGDFRGQTTVSPLNMRFAYTFGIPQPVKESATDFSPAGRTRLEEITKGCRAGAQPK